VISVQDVISRVKRMQGYDVWDRPGYDMHGLPTEKATEKELGITTREEILQLGTEKFIEHCRALCIRNMNDMTEVFKAMGVWMQWDDPYISIDRDYMEGEWWLIKKVHDAGRLYEGEKTMTWDSVNGTALAKHELYYSTVTDKAIYVRFKLLSTDPAWENTSVVIWTTTPWTIPFNLAVMVNPNINYCQVELDLGTGTKERVLVAEALLKDFVENKLKLEPESYKVLRTMSGSSLKGLHYKHPFDDLTPKYKELKSAMPSVHTVLLNSDFVTTEVGTGIVHVAPGCGPEDYVVGQQNGIRPFNAVNVSGVYEGFEPFNGLLARKDDPKFIELINKHGSLVHHHDYEHDYPFGERSKEPVIYRTTKQWFFRVEGSYHSAGAMWLLNLVNTRCFLFIDMKAKLLEEHEKIKWVPEAAGNSFRSWLENLRDNSISKQRFWGTPVPIWRNVDDPSDYVVVGSVKELAELAKLPALPEDIHIPTVDTISFTKVSAKDGKEHLYKRVPDVLDVWVDAGTACFNTLRFPARVGEDVLKQWFPMSFVRPEWKR
jgi:isoleucyl-tRNA synthetase